MANGSAATLSEGFQIPLKRPRDRLQIMADLGYYTLRNYALDVLYNRIISGHK